MSPCWAFRTRTASSGCSFGLAGAPIGHTPRRRKYSSFFLSYRFSGRRRIPPPSVSGFPGGFFVELGEPVAQGVAADAEHPGRQRFVAGRAFERLPQHPFFG